MRRGDRGHLGVVVGGRDLDHIGADQPFPGQAAQEALAVQVLGAVVEYDTEHSGGLVASVRVWLEHDRQTDRAARALHIHPNTLLYRIRRFEQISGRSLASTESLAEVWLAMRTTVAVPEG